MRRLGVRVVVVALLLSLGVAKASAQDTLLPNDALSHDEYRVSPSGDTVIYLQTDGLLIVCHAGHGCPWNTGLWPGVNARLVMQGDGNLVLLDENQQPIWSTNTWGHPDAYLQVMDGGNVVICGPEGHTLWATNTGLLRCPTGPHTTVLVNGSLTGGVMPDWMLPSHAEFQAISATYGADPLPWYWSQDSKFEVTIASGYFGIYHGALNLASYLSALPPGDVNTVAHSHGGNVVRWATWFMSRPIRHLINFGTPVNSDLWDSRHPVGAYSMCQISSDYADRVQFDGASPDQVAAYEFEMYLYYYYSELAWENWGNWFDYLWYSELANQASSFADGIFWGTKIEFDGVTRYAIAEGLAHGDLVREPWLWFMISLGCAVN